MNSSAEMKPSNGSSQHQKPSATRYRIFVSWGTAAGGFLTPKLYGIVAASLSCESTFHRQISLHRLKKIQEKKKVLKEKSEKERDLRRAAGGEQEPANLLAEEKDEDLLFE